MNPNGRTIILVSQAWMGHIPAYHKCFADCFAAEGWRVVSLRAADPRPTPRSGSSPSAAGRSGGLRHAVSNSGFYTVSRAVRWWWRVRRVIREQRQLHYGEPVAVFFIYLDSVFLHRLLPSWCVDLLVGAPWAGVLLRPAAIRGDSGVFVGCERVLAARRCCAIAVMDHAYVEPCRRSWPGKSVVSMPEFADVTPPRTDDTAIAAMHEFARGRRVVLLAGVINEKKGVRTLMEVARLAEVAGDPLVFVFAGAFTTTWCGASEYAALAPLFVRPPGNCWCSLDPVSEGGPFNAWVAAADVVWVAYSDLPFKGNMLTKAAHFRKPVVVTEGGIMAEYVRRYCLGLAVTHGNPKAAHEAIRSILDQPEAGRDFAGFSRQQDASRLRETVRAVSACFTL